MQICKVGSFLCLYGGFLESVLLLSFLNSASSVSQMVFLLAAAFWELI